MGKGVSGWPWNVKTSQFQHPFDTINKFIVSDKLNTARDGNLKKCSIIWNAAFLDLYGLWLSNWGNRRFRGKGLIVNRLKDWCNSFYTRKMYLEFFVPLLHQKLKPSSFASRKTKWNLLTRTYVKHFNRIMILWLHLKKNHLIHLQLQIC